MLNLQLVIVRPKRRLVEKYAKDESWVTLTPEEKAGGLVFLQDLKVVQPPQEQEIGDLLDDFERVRDASGPESVPDAIDLILNFASDHVALFRHAPSIGGNRF